VGPAGSWPEAHSPLSLPAPANRWRHLRQGSTRCPQGNDPVACADGSTADVFATTPVERGSRTPFSICAAVRVVVT